MYNNDLGAVDAASLITGLFGPRKTAPAEMREDGARWSAAKQYWELPPGTKATIQSPKPSGGGTQSMQGGPVSAAAYAPYAPPSAIPTPFGGPVVAGLSTAPLLLAGVAALGIVLLSRGGRRR